MRIFLDCIPCFVRQALDSARLATDDEQIHEKVVREVLRLAADLDMSQSPPVIGCPVIASIAGADLVLIITEPTLSGKHDLKRVADLTAGFKIPTLVAINKFDLNPDMAEQIEEDARSRNIKVVGEIRYDEAFTKVQIMKATVLEYTGGAVSENIGALWRNITYAPE